MLDALKQLDWDFADAQTEPPARGLHPYPAKFIPQIPRTLIQELSSVGDTVADIFCGSGTTLLEALRLRRNAIGVDANPLAALISRARTTPLVKEDFEHLGVHRASCQRVLGQAGRPGKEDLFCQGSPFRSSAWRPDQRTCEFWFDPVVVEELAELRALIDKVPTPTARTLCMVSLSAIVVAVSKQDSDTRYVRRTKLIKPGDTVGRYLRRLDAAVSATKHLTALLDDRLFCQVLDTDILKAPETRPFDLVVTSPPYPNAYSYHLYHRTRMIWLRQNPDEFKKIEIGSHRKYSSKGPNRATPETFRKELSTILQWLSHRLRRGGHACFVIGDSTIDGKRIDNASLLAATAKIVGLREVARIARRIRTTRKAFNPRIGRIKTENILILQRI